MAEPKAFEEYVLPGEALIYRGQFGDRIKTGSPLTAITVVAREKWTGTAWAAAAVDEFTVSTPAVSGTEAQFQIDAVQLGADYRLTLTGATADGQKPVWRGLFYCRSFTQ